MGLILNIFIIYLINSIQGSKKIVQTIYRDKPYLEKGLFVSDYLLDDIILDSFEFNYF